MCGPPQNLGPIGSAVLTFIGYKQIDTQAKFMYRLSAGICPQDIHSDCFGKTFKP